MYVFKTHTKYDDMSIEEFCADRKSPIQEFNNVKNEFASIGFSDEESITLTKSSYFYLNRFFDKNKEQIEETKRLLDAFNEIS